MDQKIIARLEELVEEISDCYTSVPMEIVNELNALTKNDWTENDYIEYCAEYWSRSTLEETVYALLHCGEYPDNVETKLYFWKNQEPLDLPDEKIMFKLRRPSETVDDDFICNFDDLPIREFYNWLKSFLADWSLANEITEADIKSGSFKGLFNYEHIEEYAKYKSIRFKVYGNKLLLLDCYNLYENEKAEILSFLNNYGVYLYEK